MRVHLTFDVEVWCNGWRRLDEAFPKAFERYVWGRSARGEYGLPHNLALLQRYGLVGVFFVEPLFSLRFGSEHLRTVTSLILQAGQEVQLHLHPEWVDEIRPPLIEDISRKRQHLTHYTLEEQTALLGHARRLVESATGRQVTAFRSGSYAVNRNSYLALAANGLLVDSSLNTTGDHAGGTLGDSGEFRKARNILGVACYPVTVFQDGFGRDRHLQVGACSFREMRAVLEDAHRKGCEDVVIVSHNFELLKPGTAAPDMIVVRRFEALCEYLAAHPDAYQVGGFPSQDQTHAGSKSELRAGPMSTTRRYVEQGLRRIVS